MDCLKNQTVLGLKEQAKGLGLKTSGKNKAQLVKDIAKTLQITKKVYSPKRSKSFHKSPGKNSPSLACGTHKHCQDIVQVNGISICNDHADKLQNLCIYPSGIHGAGYGLFAGGHGFHKGDIVGEYSRYDIGVDSKKFKCPKNQSPHECYEYVFSSDYGKDYDGRHAPDLLTRYSNDARGPRNNAYFKEFGRRVFIMAARNIAPYCEIFTDYGSDYDWSFIEDD